jgi:hypothetical protein
VGIRATIHALRPGTLQTGPYLDRLELDKAWHGIEFLLSSSRDGGPGIERFLLSGVQIEDVGDAEIFYHSPQDVAVFAELLQKSSPRLLRERFDGDRMEALNIYPEFSWGQDALDYLIGHYKRLQDFVFKHASEANALLVVIC